MQSWSPSDPNYGNWYVQLTSGASGVGTLTRSFHLEAGQSIEGWLQAVGAASVGIMIISSGTEGKSIFFSWGRATQSSNFIFAVTKGLLEVQ